MNFKFISVAIIAVVLAGCQHSGPVNLPEQEEEPPVENMSGGQETAQEEAVVPVQEVTEEQYTTVDFTDHDTDYQFKGLAPPSYQVEYVPQIESINIYVPAVEGDAMRDKRRDVG